MIKIKLFFTIILFFLNSNLYAEYNFYENGKNLFDNKKFNLAKFKFEQDIVFNPKNEKSYLYLAKIYKNEKNDLQEEKNLKTVILLNPNNESAVYDLILLKIRKSNYSETKKLISDFKKICKNLCSESTKLQLKLDSSLKN
mgnify:CR=1 FL=1